MCQDSGKGVEALRTSNSICLFMCRTISNRLPYRCAGSRAVGDYTSLQFQWARSQRPMAPCHALCQGMVENISASPRVLYTHTPSSLPACLSLLTSSCRCQDLVSNEKTMAGAWKVGRGTTRMLMVVERGLKRNEFWSAEVGEGETITSQFLAPLPSLSLLLLSGSDALVSAVVESLEKEGRNAYPIPVGGLSSPCFFFSASHIPLFLLLSFFSTPSPPSLSLSPLYPFSPKIPFFFSLNHLLKEFFRLSDR